MPSVEILIIGAALYLAPSAVALLRRHPRKVAIIALNLLLGWSGIGWIAALAWALIRPRAAQDGPLAKPLLGPDG